MPNSSQDQPRDFIVRTRGVDRSKRRAAANIGLALLLTLGLTGYISARSLEPTYTTSADIQLPHRAAATIIHISDPRKEYAIARAVAPGGVLPHERVVFITNDMVGNKITVVATAQGQARSAQMADAAAQLVVRQDHRSARVAMRRPPSALPTTPDVGTAMVSRPADPNDAVLSSDTPVSPMAHILQLGAFTLAAILGFVGLLGLNLPAIVQSRSRAEAITKSTSQMPEVENLPALHTLITVIPRVSDAPDQPSPEVVLDQVLVDRLDQYKQYSPDSGCVLLVTAGFARNAVNSSQAAAPGIGAAILAIAEQLALSHNKAPLVIDTGSTIWGKGRAGGVSSVDTLELPDVPGVYDILKRKASLEDCILHDDEGPDIKAIASGAAPKDWPDLLRSLAMQEFIRTSRAQSDLILIYAPPCMDRSETLRIMSGWTNGVLLVGLADQQAEASAVQMLRELEVKLFGRIELRQ